MVTPKQVEPRAAPGFMAPTRASSSKLIEPVASPASARAVKMLSLCWLSSCFPQLSSCQCCFHRSTFFAAQNTLVHSSYLEGDLDATWHEA